MPKHLYCLGIFYNGSYYEVGTMINKYHVQPGDTMCKIVEKFELHLNGIVKENNINELKFIENQTILIPLPIVNSIKLYEYKTSENDTLLSIENLFKVAIKEIKYFNDLFNLILVENQELTINDENVSQVFVIDYDNI
ncbi:MAG: LysM domain [Haloplasmataceae bacterium]|jgi:LysM repeat protein|nr:LysM domain [Haloplasmataceae bacterium]